MKPGQRKVLFTCFKRNDKREVKVAQLAGSVAELSAYHHGEVSDQLFFFLVAWEQNIFHFLWSQARPVKIFVDLFVTVTVVIHWLWEGSMQRISVR